MANVYDSGKSIALNAIAARVYRALLVTSAYAYNKADATLADIVGEVTALGYSRQTLANVAVVGNELQADILGFGAVAVGETTNGVIVFERVTGVDLLSDPLIAYVSLTSTAFTGQLFNVLLNSVSPGSFYTLTD